MPLREEENMNKRTCLRFVLLGIMLLLCMCLLATDRNSRAAKRDACEECYEACEYSYDGCVAAHGAGCMNHLIQCNVACFNNECTQ